MIPKYIGAPIKTYQNLYNCEWTTFFWGKMEDGSDVEITITYETLFDILRREKGREDLQKLNPSFYQDLITYLKEKKKAEEDAGNPLNEISLTLSNIRKLIRELHDRREKKILWMALDKARSGSALISTENMLSEEKDMFKETSDLLIRFRTGILQRLLQSELPKVDLPKKLEVAEAEQKKSVTLLFREDVNKFFGKDLETYGPFIKDDIANLPEDVASLLIKNGKAEALQGN